MEFSVFDMAEVLKTGAWESPLGQQLIEWEHTWPDHTNKIYETDLERCKDHLRNIVNGKLAEVLFSQWVGDDLGLIYREKLGYYLTERKQEDIGQTDYYTVDGRNVEFKAFEQNTPYDAILNELNNVYLYKRKYHECDELYVWLPRNGYFWHFIKENGLWVKKSMRPLLDGEIIEKMIDQYNSLRVDR